MIKFCSRGIFLNLELEIPNFNLKIYYFFLSDLIETYDIWEFRINRNQLRLFLSYFLDHATQIEFKCGENIVAAIVPQVCTKVVKKNSRKLILFQFEQ